MSILQAIRKAKHRLFVVQKQVRWMCQDTALWVNDRRWAALEAYRPYRYAPARYPHTFISRPSIESSNDQRVPQVIYCCWTGGNELTPNRINSLEVIRDRNPETPIILVTPDNVDNYIVPGSPFHPAYENLGDVQKSDYLRAYLLHHHGGGYLDIKEPPTSWDPLFRALNAQPTKWVLGYREVTSNYTAELPRELGRDLKRHYRAVLGPSALIVRPKTSFTAEWMRETENRMNYFEDALAESPGRKPYDNGPAYPIRWTELGPDVVHQLSLKYQDRLIFDDRIKPQLKEYR